SKLIDQFLEEDIKFEPVRNEEEELPVEDNEQVIQQEVASEEIEEGSSNFFDETLHQLTEEEDTSLPIVEEETEEASITEIEETPIIEEAAVFTPTPLSTESEEEKVPIEVTETDAIILFNEGKLQEALEVYKKLIAHYPDKTSYYTTQMEIMGLDVQQEDLQQEDTPKETVVEEPEEIILEKLEEAAETIDFTPDLEMPEVSQEESTEEETVADVEFNPAQLVEVTDKKKKKQAIPQSAEEYTELDAMSMFNEGRTEEAIEIYHKLMLQHPEKKAYFEAQINILES
ncbi:MAG: tetratricopeptide repeat protein, partial [Bacteroidota bacterium]